MSIIDPEIPYNNQKRIEGILNISIILLVFVIVFLFFHYKSLFPLKKIETRNVIFSNKNQAVYEIITDETLPQKIISNSIKRYIKYRESWNSLNRNRNKNEILNLFETENIKNIRLNFEIKFNEIIKNFQSFERQIISLKNTKITKDTYSITMNFYDKVNGIIQPTKKAEIKIKYKFKQKSNKTEIMQYNPSMLDIINYNIKIK